ncbi:MAG: hypothetical protein KJ799_07775 [Bacteroidetes bacterium]|nr:hypothetical protein [Bacteroidota bacterium]MBU2506606.1 hypothetical protein [Bacteroidota bacterium]
MMYKLGIIIILFAVSVVLCLKSNTSLTSKNYDGSQSLIFENDSIPIDIPQEDYDSSKADFCADSLKPEIIIAT